MVDMGALVGSLHRFGLEGPAYEVLGVAARSSSGEQQMQVRLIESGELLDYPLADILSDPSEG